MVQALMLGKNVGSLFNSNECHIVTTWTEHRIDLGHCCTVTLQCR